jgi:UTP--glucose-1-phosphate uridylyltransferase
MQLTQAILPVAGLGTRFLPWTKVVPKELLPLGNQPIIGLLVDECLSVGIKDICLIISKGKELIPQYFEEDAALRSLLAKKGKESALAPLDKYKDVTFHTVYQDEQLGDGHALLQAAGWVKSEAVAVLFGDDLIHGKQNGLQQLAAAYEQAQLAHPDGPMPAMLCLENVPRELVIKYGIADVTEPESANRLKKVKGLVEKPKPEESPSTLGVIGKYIIPASTFAVLPQVQSGQGGEIRLIDALIHQMPELPVYGWEAEGKRFDTGTPEGYKEAVAVLG